MKNNQEKAFFNARLNLLRQNGNGKSAGPALGEGMMGAVGGTVGGAVSTFVDAIPAGMGGMVGAIVVVTAAGALGLGLSKKGFRTFSKKNRKKETNRMADRVLKRISERTNEFPIHILPAEHNPAEDLEHVVTTTRRGGKKVVKEGDLVPQT